MKLYTNPNNPHALKILICASFAQQEVEVEIVKVSDKRFQCPRRLPVLELESGNAIFSNNVASSFILRPSKDLEVSTTEWLTWDTVKLQPLIPFIGSKIEPVERIEALLSELNTALNSKDFLVGNQLTSADICVSCTIFPLISDEKLKAQYLKNKPNIIKWSDKLFSNDRVKAVKNKYSISSGSEALLSIASSSWYPSPSDNITLPDNDSDPEQEEALSQEVICQAVKAWESGLENRVKLKLPSHPV